MVNTLIFDWGGVLMRTVDPMPRLAWERRLDLPFTSLPERFFSSDGWHRAMISSVALRDVWVEMNHDLKLEEDELAALSRDFWAGDRLDRDLVALISDLKGKGVRTALLSNHSIELADLMVDLGVEELFDVRVISAFEGTKKPDPVIWQRVLERLGAAPEETVFVDDWQPHVDTARGLGIAAVRFRGLRHLQRNLAGLGLPVTVPRLEPVPGVRAVIFDWGGVLSPLSFFDGTAAWEEHFELEPGSLNQILWGLKWKELEIGAISSEEYDAHVGHNLGLPDRAAVQQFYREYYAEEFVDENVVAAVRSLRGDYQLALLSNAFPGQAQQIKEQFGFDVYEEFDVYVNSAEVGMAKPDPAIYELTLDRLGVAPYEAVFADDTVRNTDGANLLGIHTVVFTDSHAGLADLSALLGHSITDPNPGSPS
jgi:HAD superfamily hydrolase (TIGR01509 family)